MEIMSRVIASGLRPKNKQIIEGQILIIMTKKIEISIREDGNLVSVITAHFMCKPEVSTTRYWWEIHTPGKGTSDKSGEIIHSSLSGRAGLVKKLVSKI